MASSASPNPATARSDKLFKHLGSILHGKRTVASAADARLLLEAICSQQDHPNCIEKLVASPSALDSLRIGLRRDVSAAFINGYTAPFLKYLSDPAVKQLCNGQLLQQLLDIIAEPPTLWNALLLLHKDRVLTPDSEHSFAWLLLELLSLPVNGKLDVHEPAKRLTDDRSFLDSSSHDTRTLGQKIKHVLLTRSSSALISGECAPGGRHDNDFADFRQISILPTLDEFKSSERPFYRRADAIGDVPPEQRVAVHLDNQFRLLREAMLGDLRSDFQVAMGLKKGKRSVVVLSGLWLEGIDCGTEQKRKPCALTFRCENGLRQLSKLERSKRKAFLDENRYFLKHQAFGCLVNGNEIVAFATVDRNEDLLMKDTPIVVLQPAGSSALKQILLAVKQYQRLNFLSVDTAIFAYEPVLKCLQEKTGLPLADELLSWDPSQDVSKNSLSLDHIVQRIRDRGGQDIQDVFEKDPMDDLLASLHTPKPIKPVKPINLDRSQTESLIQGLTQALSLIQGPPGTGKSFIGALLAKVLHDYTKKTILVLCYTNHALDQFLEDLLRIGIPPGSMVRLGAKSTLTTKPLNLFEQASNYKRSKASYDFMNMLSDNGDDEEDSLLKAFGFYLNFPTPANAILEYLEFSENDRHFYDALVTPAQEGDMTRVGKRGKAVSPFYLFDQWSTGKNAGIFQRVILQEHGKVWGMDLESRRACVDRWRLALLREAVDKVNEHAQSFNMLQNTWNVVRNERDTHTIKQKRIIACTTTAAAKYTQSLQAASPSIILVEEAGEILESHILTAMTPETEQLILIGDHQQLRPKVENYALRVEKGDGYDLDRSLFERLVLAGFPHATLTKQHRMCPEISSLVRHLTYPDLLDSPSTLSRAPIRGLQSRVVFFSHDHLEVEAADVADRRDHGSKTSKQNDFEVEMVLKCVRYMAQQGYGTDKQVVLTPYLGQLHLLRLRLRAENDPVLNDLDSADLVRAGLLPPASANASKRPIRISTIDNYQGEESDIVIATLTRSNKTGDIGFMAAPQRLNVLLSRARDALILIGNAETFKSSRKSKESWVPLLDHLSRKGQLFDGLPVKCERHPDKRAVLRTVDDFETECPDGGCSAPCGTKLNCGVHDCPQRCHQLSDHSKMQCGKILESLCPKNHKISWQCFKKSPVGCRVCDQEARRLEEKRQRDHKLDDERQAKQREYAQQLALIEDELAHERRLQRDRNEQAERDKTLLQRRKDLADFMAANFQGGPDQIDRRNQANTNGSNVDHANHANESASPPKPAATQSPEKIDLSFLASSAKDEWERQKEFEGQQNEALDELMKLIGLEDVKEQFLSIKDKVDTAVRQNIDTKDERFGAALLGNPGTGKTTVARLYGKFLASVGALPGSFFVETTGSRLANEGVSGCKKQIEEILSGGGGAMFIDEAYQLASGHNNGGRQVLDFLLAEVENLTGKVVFILAGYNKQMEEFFAHNPGLPSRFPHELQFKDYTDTELLQILGYQINKKYNRRMNVDGGMGGLYARVVARRVGRGRGREGFGNARAVANAFARITERQAKRLQRERRAGLTPDDLLLTKEDLLGPEPSAALKGNESWSKLQSLIGLSTVKQSVQALFDSLHLNYCRELEEQPLLEYSLNRVFLGSPGTGKTSVAKLYGQILADIGLLSSGQVVVKNPADFTGSVLGQSEEKTKGILASTVGKVLVIDEAYGLYGGGSGSSGDADIYKKAIIDTIVAEVQSVPGEDRCVLLLGYKDEMERMFQNVNPGLSRRFPLDSAFVFEDFTDVELQKILDLKLKDQGFKATDQAKRVALDVLRRARNRPNFGNAGEVDILLNAAKMRHQQRLSTEKSKNSATLEARDIDKDFDRGERAETNIQILFKGVVGCGDVVAQLQGYQRTAANMKARDMDPREQIPFSFLFRGPPGTGKTTTAQKIGKVYYDMGFLATAEVVECSATDLVGQYVGQTGPKTQKLLEKALGKVLFIDEAYRLAEGHFAKEAMDELVDCLTKPKYAQKLVTILAGYDADINRLMSINPGLTSRFPETIVFRPLSPEECLDLFRKSFQRRKKLDTSILGNTALSLKLLQMFEELSKLDNWGNARDILTLEKKVFRAIVGSTAPSQADLVVDEQTILQHIQAMVSERLHRSQSIMTLNHGLASANETLRMAPQDGPVKQPPITKISQSAPPIHSPAEIPLPPPQDVARTASADGPSRDAGVSEETWTQLQQDKLAAETREKTYQTLLNLQSSLEKAQIQPEPSPPSSDDEDDEARRLFEAQRIKHELERRAREEKFRELEKKRKEMEAERKKEAEAQKKLRKMGVCVAGFRWIKQSGGYRCAGGSHWVGDNQLGL